MLIIKNNHFNIIPCLNQCQHIKVFYTNSMKGMKLLYCRPLLEIVTLVNSLSFANTSIFPQSSIRSALVPVTVYGGQVQIQDFLMGVG